MIPYVCVFIRFRAAIFQSQNHKKKVEKSLYAELKREAYHIYRQHKVAGDICVFVYTEYESLRSPFLKMDHPMMTGRK